MTAHTIAYCHVGKIARGHERASVQHRVIIITASPS